MSNTAKAEAPDLLADLNPEQIAVVKHLEGAALVVAVAGAGKTRSLVHRIAYMVNVRGINPATILATTFSKKAADEMNDRLAALGVSGGRVGTWHSLAWQIVREERPHSFGTWEVDSKDRFRTLVKIVLGYTCLKWDNADLSKVMHYISTCKSNLADPMSIEAKAIAESIHSHNPCAQNDPTMLMQAYDEAWAAQVQRKLMTFDDMIFFACKILLEDDEARDTWSHRFDYLLQDEAQDCNYSQGVIAEQLARRHGNYMCVGDPGQCHPAGTMIDIGPGVTAPIESLHTGDVIRSWNRNAQKMIGGKKVEVSSRLFTGIMREVRCGKRFVKCTPNHKFVAKWSDRTVNDCVVYLMYRRGFGYRVGWCKLFSQEKRSNNLHLAMRARIEKADATWVLSVHQNRTDASVTESIIAAEYGLPTVTFEPVNGAKHLTEESIKKIFGSITDLDSRGERCLNDFDLVKEQPLYHWPGKTIDQPQGRRTVFQVHASNLLPDLMAVPDPDSPCTWFNISDVEKEFVQDETVYSLNVEKDETYSANGIVVHNSIYGFRGAMPEKLLAFEKEWNATVIQLHRNYRSGQEILDAANGVIDSMDPKTHLGVHMTSGLDDAHANIAYKRHGDSQDEAESIAAHCREYNASGHEWQDMVVLYRTNVQSRALEEAMIADRIPYVVLGSINFYNRKEVRDLMGYLRVATGNASFDDVKRCINTPFRYLGKAFLNRIEQEGKDGRDWVDVVRDVAMFSGLRRNQQTSALQWAAIIDSLRASIEIVDEALEEDPQLPEDVRESHCPAAMFERVIKETDYMRHLSRDEGSETTENNRPANVRELVNVASGFQTLDSFFEYVDHTIEASRKQKDEKKNVVTLCTIHKSKGLEWPIVFVTGANMGIMPSAYGDDDEERRLFYVATTRAKTELHFSSYRGARDQGPSKFLREAGVNK